MGRLPCLGVLRNQDSLPRNREEADLFFCSVTSLQKCETRTKRYLNETGSGWVQGLADPAAAHDIFLTRITRVEVVAAVTRRGRGGCMPASAVPAMLAQFRHDAAHQ